MSNDEDYANVTAPAQTTAIGPATRKSLEQAGKSGANWFYWVAALSLVNTALAHGGGDLHFIVGLSFSAIIDGIALELGKRNPDQVAILTAVAVGLSVAISLIVSGFGWLSGKRILWVYAIGMVLYLLDGVIYLFLGDIMSAGFHGYALLGMFNGFNAFGKLKRADDAEYYGEEEETPPE